MEDHLQRPPELRGLGRDFVYGWHSRDATFVETFRRITAKEWEVQLGPNTTMDDKDMSPRTMSSVNIDQFLTIGLYELEKGNMVWVRDLDSIDVIPENDNLQVFVLHPYVPLCKGSVILLTWRYFREEFGTGWDTLAAKLNDLRDRSLGPREQRTKERVAFEANERATRIKGARCYSVGLNT